MKHAVIVVASLLWLSGCGQWTWMRARPAAHEADTPAAETAATAASQEPVLPPDTAARVLATAPTATKSAGPYEGYQLIRPPEVVEALVLQVNDHTITVNEVLRPIRGKLMEIPQGVSEDAFRRQADLLIAAEIRRQITEIMVLDEANRALAEEEKKKVEEDLNGVVRDMIATAGGSRTKLDQDYRRQGTTLDEVIEAERRQMLARRYLNRKFLPQLGVTRDDLYRYYVQNRDAEFSSPAKVQMQIVCVPYRAYYPPGQPSPSSTALAAAKRQARDRAEQAAEKIRQGTDFGDVAREFGIGYGAEQGGLWEPLEAGSFRESEVEATAFAQPVGQVSEVIEGQTGCFLVKTVERQAGNVVSFEQAQRQIEQTLREKQYDDLSRAYYSELYGGATIISADKFEQRVLGRAVQLYHRP